MAPEARAVSGAVSRRGALLAVALAALSLAACGKRGDPIPPGPDAAVTYPRTYPREEGQGPPAPSQGTVFPQTSRGVRGNQ
jgi:predicted small lipoprotein YifL